MTIVLLVPIDCSQRRKFGEALEKIWKKVSFCDKVQPFKTHGKGYQISIFSQHIADTTQKLIVTDCGPKIEELERLLVLHSS